jgi:hypothetical protein
MEMTPSPAGHLTPACADRISALRSAIGKGATKDLVFFAFDIISDGRAAI